MKHDSKLANDIVELYDLLHELNEKKVQQLGIDIIEAIILSIENDMLDEFDKAA